MSDEDLVAAVGRGDCDALRALYERHAPWLVVRLSRRFGDVVVVDEVVQDTFVAVWKGARRYEGTGDVGAWIWGIGIRRCVDHLRRRRVLPAIARESHEPSAEDRVLLGIEHGDLAGAIDRLSHPSCEKWCGRRSSTGLTAREAGVLLGVPSGTVKTRLMRARRQLREALA